MALDMSNATYARSTKGAKTLKETSFASDITKIKNALNGDKYAKVKSTVKAYWVGADADDFLNDIEKTRKDVLNQISSLQSKFNTAIDQEAREFKSFQSKNVR